jgi:hypothetical protein
MLWAHVLNSNENGTFATQWFDILTAIQFLGGLGFV